MLPPDIGSLTALNRLTLSDTQVSDISALSGLTALRMLNLRDTQVSDISALSGLTALEYLSLPGTPVSDISALSGLEGLKYLDLSRTQVNDISALSGLEGLIHLDLSGTQVNDIAALSGLTALSFLELSGTQVKDLSPLLSLTQFLDAHQSAGLAFKNTAADPRITEIAEIGDAAKRVTDLFAYLREIPKGVARSIEKLDTRVDTTQQDVTELETRVSTAIKRLDGFDADYESRLEAAAAAFREDNALKAPVVLWQEKETKHQA